MNKLDKAINEMSEAWCLTNSSVMYSAHFFTWNSAWNSAWGSVYYSARDSAWCSASSSSKYKDNKNVEVFLNVWKHNNNKGDKNESN